METLSAGADLIQIYTGLVYRGPRLISEILEAIAKMRQSERPAAINAQQSVLPDRRDDAAPG